MNDIAVPVGDTTADVGRIGGILGSAGIELEGGGVWGGVAHYLVADGRTAVAALDAAGIQATSRLALVIALRADVPGEVGRMMSALHDAGIQVEAQYSDHDNRKVFVVDDPERAEAVLR